MDINEQLAREWTTLQNNHESHERSALLIKLVAVVLSAVAWVLGLDAVVLCALVLVLWCQEAVLKTWQTRLAARLTGIELAFRRGSQSTAEPFQLHSRWLAQRPGLAGLLVDYARSAVRPTVAFPYAVLVILAISL